MGANASKGGSGLAPSTPRGRPQRSKGRGKSLHHPAPASKSRHSGKSSRGTAGSQPGSEGVDEPGEEVQTPARKLQHLKVEDIRKATGNFSQRVGEGGFGVVYKGSMALSEEGGPEEEIAVKVLKPGSMQGFKEWQAEVQLLSKLRHPNLVELYGYVCKAEDCMLVYRWYPNRSLDMHLFPRREKSATADARTPDMPAAISLGLKARLKILLGAAEGLQYLHQGSGRRYIFRDFKTSNILLDQDLNAKLCDFGFVREGPKGCITHVSTLVVGTSHYIAPEYIERGHVSTSSDVYSFGVVMLEMVTGRAASEMEGGMLMQQWAIQTVAKDGEGWREVLDARLDPEESEKAASFLLACAECCLAEDPHARPPMEKIVEGLRKVCSVCGCL